MFFTRLFTVLYVFTAVRASALLGNSTAVVPSPNLVPIAPMGNVASVQVTTGDTRIFYQDSTGAINIGGVTAPFLSGGAAKANTPFIPAGEVLPYTPIAAITANTATYTGIRIYFFSRENVLSEYIWAPNVGFTGGPTCTKCLTAQGIVAQKGSEVLYAMANPAFNQFRVGFISAGQPATISEAENLGGGWGVAAWA
ncbi:hypothetical protein FB451DRAFT_1406535 [Mycena latifolia]|nr:hypothetical protein FB451DRAFT_1193530 [Mycena latifolia]KAJ7458235.1 hypothetical protein FB451DRAFT_1406535 [Mycena latifolia]